MVYHQKPVGIVFVYWSGMKKQNLISPCLLYTSDAADERSSVDLGGRRIIKKKKTIKISSKTTKEKHTRPQSYITYNQTCNSFNAEPCEQETHESRTTEEDRTKTVHNHR